MFTRAPIVMSFSTARRGRSPLRCRRRALADVPLIAEDRLCRCAPANTTAWEQTSRGRPPPAPATRLRRPTSSVRARALSEDGVVLERAAVADDRPRVHHDARPEDDALADRHVRV